MNKHIYKIKAKLSDKINDYNPRDFVSHDSNENNHLKINPDDIFFFIFLENGTKFKILFHGDFKNYIDLQNFVTKLSIEYNVGNPNRIQILSYLKTKEFIIRTAKDAMEKEIGMRTSNNKAKNINKLIFENYFNELSDNIEFKINGYTHIDLGINSDYLRFISEDSKFYKSLKHSIPDYVAIFLYNGPLSELDDDDNPYNRVYLKYKLIKACLCDWDQFKITKKTNNKLLYTNATELELSKLDIDNSDIVVR